MDISSGQCLAENLCYFLRRWLFQANRGSSEWRCRQTFDSGEAGDEQSQIEWLNENTVFALNLYDSSQEFGYMLQRCRDVNTCFLASLAEKFQVKSHQLVQKLLQTGEWLNSNVLRKEAGLLLFNTFKVRLNFQDSILTVVRAEWATNGELNNRTVLPECLLRSRNDNKPTSSGS